LYTGKIFGFDICFCNLLFEINSFGISAVLLCLVPEQVQPVLELKLRTIFWCFDLCKISSSSEKISMPTRVEISVSILQLYEKKNAHTHHKKVLCLLSILSKPLVQHRKMKGQLYHAQIAVGLKKGTAVLGAQF
jgi:hypothetical protein